MDVKGTGDPISCIWYIGDFVASLGMIHDEIFTFLGRNNRYGFILSIISESFKNFNIAEIRSRIVDQLVEGCIIDQYLFWFANDLPIERIGDRNLLYQSIVHSSP